MKEAVSFDEFTALSFEEWKVRLQEEIGDKPLNAHLKHFSRENFNLNIREDNQSVLQGINAPTKNIPDFFAPNEWFMGVLILAKKGEEEKLNKEILILLENGCNSLKIQITETLNWDVFFKDIEKDYIQLFIEDFSYNQEAGLSLRQFLGTSSTVFYSQFTATAYLCNAKAFNLIDIAPFANAGAGIQLQLTLMLMALSEIVENNSTDKPKEIGVNLAVGSEILLETAKIRAARFLIHRFLKAYGGNLNFIVSVENSALLTDSNDKENNILRASAACLSAALGGVESIFLLPFESSFFGQKTALNLQLLAKEESNLHKQYDSLCGSEVVEKYTHTISENSWLSFLKLRDKFSFNELLKSDELTSMITADKLKLKESIKAQKKVFIGVNKYLKQDNARISDVFYRYPKNLSHPLFSDIHSNINTLLNH